MDKKPIEIDIYKSSGLRIQIKAVVNGKQIDLAGDRPFLLTAFDNASRDQRDFKEPATAHLTADELLAAFKSLNIYLQDFVTRGNAD